MAHLLLLDVPGGNDFTVLEDAVAAGHEVTFYTSDLEHYRRQGGATTQSLALARDVIEVKGLHYASLEYSVLEKHQQSPFHGILCLIDIHLVAASRLAEKLGLRFLNPESARMLRDKFSVRQHLSRQGLRQPNFSTAPTPSDLRSAVARVGYPAIVKPSDGYGSQDIRILFNDADLELLLISFDQKHRSPTDYGLGVCASNRFTVEQYMSGELIGCDVFSDLNSRVFLGINDKIMFPPPSFAFRGSCFPAVRFDTAAIQKYAFDVLDAVNFDFGAAHLEMILMDGAPYLVEINPRLVSAQIPYQMAYALERSIYVELINLHLGAPLANTQDFTPKWYSAIRWFTAPVAGLLQEIRLPRQADLNIRRVALFKEPGDPVAPPLSNGDRIGYVIAVGKTMEDAGNLAERYVAETVVGLC